MPKKKINVKPPAKSKVKARLKRVMRKHPRKETRIPVKSKPARHPAEQYIADIQSGKIVSCRFVKLAVERHVRDLKEGGKRGLYFDREKGAHAIDFFKFLRHSKGKWAGEPIQLEPWQQFILWVVFGWMNEDGSRRFREVYEEVARKNGKSTKLSGVGLKLFAADGEHGAEVYTAATKRDQARITHSEAKRMVKSSPFLRKRIIVVKDNLSMADGASKFEPLGADSDTEDGLNVHGAIIDELHAHKNGDMVDVLDSALGSRRQPLLWYITTAGSNRETVCWRKREYLRKILAGIIEDDSYFGIIFTIDKKTDWPDLLTQEEADKKGAKGQVEDEWSDPSVWIKANPNLDVSVSLSDMHRMAKKALEMPSERNNFLRKKLNVWVSSAFRWLNMAHWDGSAGDVHYEELLGLPCYAGLDLSVTTDLTALVLVFPYSGDFKVFPFFWVPEEGMAERIKRDGVPYDIWVEQGYIQTTPGDFIDYASVLRTLDQVISDFTVMEVAYDRYGAQKIVTDMTEKELKVIPFGQGTASMSAPCKELERLLPEKRLHHGGHPVLRWMADNVVAVKNDIGDMKPSKDKSTARIDGIVAMLMALDRATRNEGAIPGSLYDRVGLRSV